MTVRAKPVYGPRGKIGVVVPANNSVLEPEWWSALPAGFAVYATRVMARGDLTPEAIVAMESQVERAVDELVATGVDVIVYADMVTTFIMSSGWNEEKVDAIERHTGLPALSAWTALRDALAALGARRIALGTPYPARIHALAPPFFAERHFTLSGDATLDIVAMREVPTVDASRLLPFVRSIPRAGADALVLLATDLPCFGTLAALEAELGIPVLTSNQTLLWRALRRLGAKDALPALGRLGSVPAR